MREVSYKVKADVRVERVDTLSEDLGGSSDHDARDVNARRLVAIAVVWALCECQSGSTGGCHHVCEMLQLARLLAFTDAEMEMWDPDSSTSRACQWIRQTCGAKRGTETDFFHHAPVSDIALTLWQLRDPKKVAIGVADGGVAKTAGLVSIDRRREFSSHPDHGVWAESHRHFREGKSYSQMQWELPSKFVDGERVSDERGDTRMAVDVLPPKVRSDSPSEWMDVTADQEF